jgi:broad specificity phosphatase PhoE
MPYLLLIRHSVSRQVPGTSAHTWELTEEGRARCLRLAEWLRPYQPAVVVNSAEPKAVQTGDILARTLGLPLETEAGLGEHRRATAPYFDTLEAFEDAVRRLLANPDDMVFGEETGTQARERFEAALNTALARYTGQTVALVTHGTVMTLFLARAAGVEPFAFWKALGMPAYVALSLPEYEIIEGMNVVL